MPSKPPDHNTPTREQWDWFESNFTHETRKRLFNEAYRIMQNKSDAEDVLADAVQIGICNLSHLRHKGSFVSWMFKIVRREAYHHLERESRLQAVRYRVLYLKTHHEISATPDKLLISQEERARLRREIERLKSPEKEILLLKLKTTKSLKEIAAELGLNYHTTRSKFTRACNLIKRRLDEEGGDGSHEKK